MKKSGWRSAQARRTNGMMPAEVPNEPSAFEKFMRSNPTDAQTRKWVKLHKQTKYVPETVLDDFGWREI